MPTILLVLACLVVNLAFLGRVLNPESMFPFAGKAHLTPARLLHVLSIWAILVACRLDQILDRFPKLLGPVIRIGRHPLLLFCVIELFSASSFHVLSFFHFHQIAQVLVSIVGCVVMWLVATILKRLSKSKQALQR